MRGKTLNRVYYAPESHSALLVFVGVYHALQDGITFSYHYANKSNFILLYCGQMRF